MTIEIEPEETSTPSVRQPGISLAAFPAQLFSLLSYPLQTRLTRGSLARRVLALAWPAVMEQALVTLIGLVDAYIVGHLGAAALAGVGLGGQVLNLTGATALIARQIGARDDAEANALARQALLLALVIGSVAALLCFFFARELITFFGATPDVVETGSVWLRMVSPSFVLLGVLLVGTGSLRGAGDMRTPLTVMLVVNVVNITVAWTLTHGLWGLPRLGVAGSGLGALSGQVIGGVMVVTLLMRGRGRLKLGWRLPRPDFHRLGRILNIGLPAGAEQVLLQIALLNMAVIISRFGTAAYAAHQVGLRISSLAFLPGWGFSLAATTLVGQELGAGRPDLARKATYLAFWFALAVMSLLGVFLLVFNVQILTLFTDDVDVIAAGTTVVAVCALIQPFMAGSFIFSGGLRGAGDTQTTLIITVCSIWALRLAAAYVLGVTLGLGLLGAWLGVGIDFGFRAVLFWLRFRSGKWAALKV
jgi:putative MATE family efflux protein